jgi:hypothetical protein
MIIVVAGIRTAHDRWSFGKGAREITVVLEPRPPQHRAVALDAAVAGGGIVRRSINRRR